jgi:CRISPR system Cascade subunit CasE
MYLSRLILNPRARAVQKDLASPHKLHRTLMASFPDNLKIPDDERVLFRVDTDQRSGVPTVLLQSFHEPDWHRLQDDAHYLLHPRRLPNVERNPATKAFDLNLQPEQMLSFRLRANPTVKHEGNRYGLLKEREQQGWLVRKGEQNGFRVVSVFLTQEGQLHSWKQGKNGKVHKLTFRAVCFNGVLQVTEPESLWRAVRRGIGRGKAFGFGLLSLAPAPA